jgi:hypothetical protein
VRLPLSPPPLAHGNALVNPLLQRCTLRLTALLVNPDPMNLTALLQVRAFAANDPWHWHSLGRASVTLFRMATLEHWR